MGLRKRGKVWHVRFKLDGRTEQTTTGLTAKMQAQQVDNAISLALKSKNPDYLDDLSREVVKRLLGDRVEKFLPGFNRQEIEGQRHGLTLCQACELAYNSKDVQSKSEEDRKRMKFSFFHLLDTLGSDRLVRTLWVEDLTDYRHNRLAAGAQPATVNMEMSTLGVVWRTLVAKQLVDRNPCREISKLNTTVSQRHVYLSYKDFQRVLARLDPRYRPVSDLAFWTGQRAGEVRLLKREDVDLRARVIRLHPDMTKEGGYKIVPLTVGMTGLLRNLLTSPLVGLEYVFVDEQGQPIHRSALSSAFRVAAEAEGLHDLHFHDLRHTWKRNARRSGLDDYVIRKIMGHGGAKDSIHDGYDLLDEAEAVTAIDRLTVDHGETRIWTRKTNGGTKEVQDLSGEPITHQNTCIN